MEGVDPPKVPVNIWILHKRALDGNKLVTSIERGPRGVYYFFTPEERIPKMMECIDSLDCMIRTQWKSHHKEILKKGSQKRSGSSKAFTQFLSNSPAIGKKYTTVENSWKRKSKLDYLAIDNIKKGKEED
eukprot:223420-Ditylum_brightwellii.AAC.1